MTTNRIHFELDGIVESKAVRAPLQWSRSTALIVPSGNRLKIDILVASCGFTGHFSYAEQRRRGGDGFTSGIDGASQREASR
jgi:hypothetical protein